MRLYNEKLEYLESTVKWCNEYINEYKRNGGYFDAFKVLTGEEDKQTKLFCEAVNYLFEIETATDNFKAIQKKYI